MPGQPPPPRTTHPAEFLLVIGVFLFLAGLVLPTLTAPFERVHEDPFAGVLARRTLDDGDADHLWADYVNHPPMLPVLTYGSLRLLGSDEWTQRLLPLLATLAVLPLLHRLLRAVDVPRPWAALALLVFLFTPMVAYYWRRNGYEPLTLLVGVALALSYFPRSAHAGPRRRLAAFALAFAGALTDWPAYFFVAALALDARLRRDPGRIRLAWAAVAGSVTGLATFLLLVLGRGASLEPLWNRYASEYTGSPVGPVTGAASLGLWFLLFFTALGLVLALWPLVQEFAAAREGRTGTRLRTRLAGDDGLALWLYFLVPATLNTVVFWDNATRHTFWLYYFAPVVAVGFALLAPQLARARPSHAPLAVLLALSLALAGGASAAHRAATTDHPAKLEALRLVDARAAPGDWVFLVESNVHEPGAWYIARDDVTLVPNDPFARPPPGGAGAWVVFATWRPPADLEDRLGAAGWEPRGAFESHNFSGVYGYVVYERPAGAGSP